MNVVPYIRKKLAAHVIGLNDPKSTAARGYSFVNEVVTG